MTAEPSKLVDNLEETLRTAIVRIPQSSPAQGNSFWQDIVVCKVKIVTKI
jgi:hypothetical protein